MSGLMQGKRVFVTGVANDRSIAWAIARQFKAEGADLAFSYPGEAMGKRTLPLVRTLEPAAVLDLDVSSDEQIDAAVKEVGKVWDSVDVLVHAIGYAPREALDGRFTDVTTREAWRITLEVSAYSLIALARAFRPMMRPGSNIVTLSYYGAEKVVTNYNVMGVAKAALEASVRYLAEDMGREGIRVNAPVRSRPWPPPASRACAPCWGRTPRRRRCDATSTTTRWAGRPSSSARRWARA
jgi:enoyl-[acyl-carrier protein] reductase I